MNKTASAAIVCLIGILPSAHSQGTFQNLDFEAAKLIFVSPGSVFIATSNALPGWTAASGNRPVTAVPYLAWGGAGVALWGIYGSSIDGSFSAGLAATVDGTASISQTGLVPADARSLLFKVSYGGAGASRSTDIVSLGGQSLPLLALSSSRDFTLFGADISAFAGQTETLNFYSSLSDPDPLGPPGYALDDIKFSPQIVPEPSVLALAGAAAALFLCRRKRSRRPADLTQADGGGSRREPSGRNLLPNRT